jgi:serine/threonine protein kinase/tetratricopeptide (TPR) repeat protein
MEPCQAPAETDHSFFDPGSVQSRRFSMEERRLSHFRILAKIGEGGMGLVYKAEDERLRRPVALKLLPPGFVADAERRERFLREAQAAAAVRHPSIAAIYEVGEDGDAVYIAMELVEGRTLRSLIDETPLAISEALRIAIEIASGLERAHTAGVIHRDLKPENVMVETDGRVKILDFGLAKLRADPVAPTSSGISHAETRARDLTQAGALLGTAAYMSPEQARGQAVDPRSDLFSLGVVLYELATRRNPFRGPTAVDTLSAILKEHPPRASGLNPDVPVALERVLEHLLAKEPQGRPASATALIEELEGVARGLQARRSMTEDVGISAREGSRIAVERTLPWRGIYWAAAVLVPVLAGVMLYRLRSAPQHTFQDSKANGAASSVRPRRSVAVLGFRNLPGRADEDWLSIAFSEMLSTELAAGGALRLISGEDVAHAKRELPLANVDSLAKATLERLGTNLGADVVVLGSYTPLHEKEQNRIRLDVRLQDTSAGETIAEEAFTGDEAELFQLASRAGIRLRQKLGANAMSAEATSTAIAALPSNQQAARLYAEGEAKLWGFDLLGARNLLVKAVAADPSFPLSHSALAGAWWQLGYEAKARAEAKRALELSEHLSREAHLLVEARYLLCSNDLPKAADVYQTLFKLFPDNVNYGLLLAEAQTRIKPSDALDTLDLLRQLPPPGNNDPRIDMYEASAQVGLDLAKTQAAAKRAVDKANSQGSHLLVARTYGILCQAYTGSSTTKAIRNCENARQSYAAAGNLNGAARVLNDLALIYAQQGDPARAETMWREALQTFRITGDIQGLAGATNNIGESLLSRGKLSEARQMLEESIPGYQASNDKDGVARVLNDLGELLAERGDLEAAKTTYQQAMATAREIDDKGVVAEVLCGLGDVAAQEDDLSAARRAYEESLALRNQAGEKQTAAETQVALGRLSIEEGHAADADGLLRKAKEQFHQEKQADDELAASVVLVRALLAQGKRSEAQAEIEGVEPLAKKSQNRAAQFQFALAVARVRLASDKPESARSELNETLKEATDGGLMASQLEAQLVLAELERKVGHTAIAQAQLTSLERAARAKGFVLIARKAAAARG